MAPTAARTVFANVPAVVPAVKRPDVGLIAPPPATTDHAGVIVDDVTRRVLADGRELLGRVDRHRRRIRRDGDASRADRPPR